MRAGDHLDDRGDSVHLDPGDDPREPVSRGLGDDGSIGRCLAALIEEAADLVEVDQALTAVGALHPEASLGLPSSKGFHGHAEHLGGLAHTQACSRTFL